MTNKSLAFIFRNNDSELLCFRHPITNVWEVVRGTVEISENPLDTVIRELNEESGITENEIDKIISIGEMELEIPTGYDRKGELEPQIYHGFRVILKNELKPAWSHTVISNGIDHGHHYHFEWKIIDEEFLKNLNPFTREYLGAFFSI